MDPKVDGLERQPIRTFPNGSDLVQGVQVQPGQSRPLAVQCVVAYWQPIDRNLFAVGGQFLKVLTAADLPTEKPEVLLPDFVGGKVDYTELLVQRPAC